MPEITDDALDRIDKLAALILDRRGDSLRSDNMACARETKRLAAEVRRLRGSVRPDYPLRCEDCGRSHYVDTSLPSEIWNQIAEPHNVICAMCIDRRLVEKGLTAEAEFYYVGEALVSKMYEERICLVCGAKEPCMTEADLKPGDPGVPCTFDPTPRELYEKNKRLREEKAKLLDGLKYLEDATARSAGVDWPMIRALIAEGKGRAE